MGHLLIVQVDHGLFDVRLGSNKLFAHSLPVSLFAVFEKALAAFGETFSHPESARLPDQCAPDVLNVLGALGDRQHESIGHQRANVQGGLKAVVVNGRTRICGDDVQRHRDEAGEILEDLGDGRGGDLVDAQFVAHEILRGLLELLVSILLGE